MSITINNVKVEITGGTAPYTFTFMSSDTCVSFSNKTNTISQADTNGDFIAETNITYFDENCLNTAVITSIVTDANGCSKTLPVTINNPCNIALSAISADSNFNYIVTATGGTPPYIYQWNFDDSIFRSEDTNPTDNQLTLVVARDTPPPTTTEVSVTVTDSNGCQDTATYTQTLCAPIADAQNVTLLCDNEVKVACPFTPNAQRNEVALSIKDCPNDAIDWSSLETSFSDPGFCLINNLDGTVNITSSTTVAAGSYTITYTVKTVRGIASNTGTINLTVPFCTEIQGIGSIPASVQITANQTVSSVLTFETLENRVVSNDSPIDWSTFQFENTPTFGTVALNTERQIEYTITDDTTTTDLCDVVKWSVKNEANQKTIQKDIVHRDKQAAPVAVADIVCVTCENPSATTDITTNDTGIIDKSTIQILTIDPDVELSRDSNHDFIFTALQTATFNNFATYKVANEQGVFSNTTNVNIKSACAGTANNGNALDITCLPKRFDLIDHYVNVNSFGNVWSEVTTSYTTQGGTITGPQGDVDFAGITSGTYIFRLQADNDGFCPGVFDTEDITIILGDTPSIVIDSAVNNGNGTGTVDFTVVGVNSLSDILITNNSAAPNYSVSPTLAGGSGTFTIFLDVGNNDIFLQALTVCGNNVFAATTIVQP